MKKKLHLQKEVVSVLDKKQMNYLTKGGGAPQTSPFICKTIPPQCDVIKTNLQNCGIEETLACLTQFKCPSDPCIEPITEDCGGGGTDTCVTVTGCYSDICPIETFGCEETNGCIYTKDC